MQHFILSLLLIINLSISLFASNTTTQEHLVSISPVKGADSVRTKSLVKVTYDREILQRSIKNNTITLKPINPEGKKVNATVTISALVGIFEGSENSQKQRITDVNGIAEFTWNPTGLGNPDSPQVLNFTLEISIAEHNLILYDWVTVTVVPEGYDLDDGTPPTTDPSGTDDPDDSGIDDQTIIIGAGAVLITIVIGGAIVLIRRN